MTLFRWSTLLAGPKHSTRVPFSAEVAVPFSVDVKEVALVPNPVPGQALNTFFGPQIGEEVFDVCDRGHSLLPPTFQVVNPLLSPVTLHLKVKVSPGQVGGAAVNCPATSPGGEYYNNDLCRLVEVDSRSCTLFNNARFLNQCFTMSLMSALHCFMLLTNCK